MTDSQIVNIGVEGDLDEVVLKQMLKYARIEVAHVYGKRGKDDLRENIKRYNQAAQHGKWVILVDLNHDAECPPPFISSWLPARSPGLQLRIAVRAVEAWLLADRNEMARFLGVPGHRIPTYPEAEENPKATLIKIARRSKRKVIREDIVPSVNTTAIQGPGYTTRLIEFTRTRWDPERASLNAPNLKRSINSLLQWRT